VKFPRFQGKASPRRQPLLCLGRRLRIGIFLDQPGKRAPGGGIAPVALAIGDGQHGVGRALGIGPVHRGDKLRVDGFLVFSRPCKTSPFFSPSGRAAIFPVLYNCALSEMNNLEGNFPNFSSGFSICFS
jgi:hypothetical protein